MADDLTLPPERPMPDLLKESMWNRLAPGLRARRCRNLGLPLAVASGVGALALGATLVFSPVRDAGLESAPVPAGAAPGAEDAGQLKSCVDSAPSFGVTLPDPGSWRSTLKIDQDSERGYLVLRNATLAAVCVLRHGRVSGLMVADSGEGPGGREGYSDLSSTRPVCGFSSIVNPREPSVVFGVATADVVDVAMLGPGDSVTPAVLNDGTFAVKYLEGSSPQDDSHRKFRVTMRDGTFREFPGK
ncbi:hypothetical protein [Amycolatopsis sp. NPDC054798]